MRLTLQGLFPLGSIGNLCILPKLLNLLALNYLYYYSFIFLVTYIGSVPKDNTHFYCWYWQLVYLCFPLD